MSDKSTIHTCQSCGHVYSGKFCNNCGERTFDEHSKSVVHLGEEAFHFLTHFEGSFFRTLKAVFTAPGKLSADYCNGIRKKYFKPVPFFLLIVVLYLLFPRYTGLNMPLRVYVDKTYDYHVYALPAARQKLVKYKGDEVKLMQAYDAKSAKIAKPMLFIMIPMAGLVLFGMFFKRRRYYFDHLIYATEFSSLFIAVNFLLLPLLVSVLVWIIPGSTSLFNDDAPTWIITNLLLAVYVSIAFRRFYKLPWWACVLTALLFMAAYVHLLEYFYKTVLYYCVMLFI